MRCLAYLFAIVSMMAPAFAEGETDLEIGISTLGAYVAPSAEIRPNLSLRVPVFGGSTSREIIHDGTRFDAEIGAPSGHIMADYFPYDRGLRLSAGVAIGSIDLSGSSHNPTLGGTTYLGEYDFQIAQKHPIAPVASVGYQHHLGDRLGLNAEVGARFSQLELSTSDTNPLTPAQRDSFNDEVEEINDELARTPVIPFVSLGLVLNF